METQLDQSGWLEWWPCVGREGGDTTRPVRVETQLDQSGWLEWWPCVGREGGDTTRPVRSVPAWPFGAHTLLNLSFEGYMY